MREKSLAQIIPLALFATWSTAYGDGHTYNYLSPGSLDNTLDLYLPDTLVPGTPTVLFIHGGGWYTGDKNDMLPLLTPLVEAGYAAVSCNYTLSTMTVPSYPQAVHDVKAVVQWIRVEGAVHGLSPTIIVSGPSAGGHLTELLATTSGVDLFEPIAAPSGGYRIQAGIPFFGLCDFPLQVNSGGQTGPFTWFLGGDYLGNEATYEEASPITWLDANDTPMSLAHGTGDTTHFIEQAEVMHAAMKALGVFCYLDDYDGWHSFWSYDWTSEDGVEHTGFEAASIMLLEQIPVLLAAGRSADIDQDGDVDTNDLLAVLADWGTCPDLPVDCPGDIDGSGQVSVDDLLAIIAGWTDAP
jgi:acetyl esterase/lipase